EEEDRKPFEYISESAQLSHKYVTAMKTQKSGIGFGQRKLHLVLGLHHTLLDSCHIARLADGDKHLVEQVGVRDDLGRFIKGLKLSPQYVGFMKRHVMIKTLQEKKKLHLVLGLRGTLYDYSRISHLSDSEKHLIGQVDSRDDLWRITAQSHEGLIKLRPFVAEFLREANKLFTLHAYSLSRPEHSDYMLKLLDPHQTYFGRRVICSRDTWMKTLDLVLVDERVLVVMDDQCSTWWTDHTNHLLQITSYRYFQRPTTTQHNGL
ncbi:FCP1 homology domain, partial [Arabidopsis suecica]